MIQSTPSTVSFQDSLVARTHDKATSKGAPPTKAIPDAEGLAVNAASEGANEEDDDGKDG